MSDSFDLLGALNKGFKDTRGSALNSKAKESNRIKLTPTEEKEKAQQGRLFLRRETASYKLGSEERPTYVHDNGFLGDRGLPVKELRKPTEADHQAFRTMYTWLAGSEFMCNTREKESDFWWNDRQRFIKECRGNQPDANLALRNFLFGRGRSRTVDYERYLRDEDKTLALEEGTHSVVKTLVRDFIDHAEAIGLNRQKFSITNTVMYAIGMDGFAKGPQGTNWRRTLGAHVIWIYGDVTATAAPNGTHIIYSANLTFHIEDKYNFNPYSSDGEMGVKDEVGGALELSGLAHQFMTYATIYRHIVWDEKNPNSVKITKGTPPPGAKVFVEDITREEIELYKAQAEARVIGYPSEIWVMAKKFYHRQMGDDLPPP